MKSSPQWYKMLNIVRMGRRVMQHKIAVKIVDFFTQRHLIEKDNEDWCIYFVETRFFSYVALLLIFFLVLPIARPLEILVLLLFVLLIRRRSGGYHCKTELGCFFFSLFIVACGLVLARFLQGKHAVQLLLLFISGCAISTGPVNQPELHLSREEYLENSHRLRAMAILLVFVAVFMVLLQISLASYCVTGLLIAAASVIAGRFIQNGRYSQCQ